MYSMKMTHWPYLKDGKVLFYNAGGLFIFFGHGIEALEDCQFHVGLQ